MLHSHRCGCVMISAKYGLACVLHLHKCGCAMIAFAVGAGLCIAFSCLSMVNPWGLYVALDRTMSGVYECYVRCLLPRCGLCACMYLVLCLWLSCSIGLHVGHEHTMYGVHVCIRCSGYGSMVEVPCRSACGP